VHLYLHIPFCARRCSYCDFAIAVRRQVPSRTYADAVLKEWSTWQDHPAWQSSDDIETIYLGGGTPSLLDPEELGRLLEHIRASRPVAADAELTIEVNPDDVTAERVARWRDLGLNRVSLGAQSFDPAVLTWMHRTHRADDVARSMGLLRAAGFDNISLDLIFALPDHLERDWRRDLDLALSLGPEHLSLYGLTVEEHTPLARWVARGQTARTDDDTHAREFLEADEELGRRGYQHYEVSNYGRPGFRSRHNSAYWLRRPFIGLGPSAHSGFDRERRWNLREWSAYRAAIEAGLAPVGGTEVLDDEATGLEELYLGLRTIEGVPLVRLPIEIVAQWAGQGWAWVQGERVALTAEGWLRLDALVRAVFPTPLPGSSLIP
jgi:oxygen-independent coproporphyrinogen III oxidase